jgi:4-diphosphocytidyl-2-C-methyl-D-erythritol kinase
MKSVRVKTPAKINLFLRVLGLRPDGYHTIETIFQAIDLHDEVILRETTGPTEIKVPGHPELESDDNLVIRALRWVQKATGRRFSVKVHLDKHIPSAAGLGGGSSDAAATLLGMQAMFDLGLGEADLHRGAVQLGADVPFFLVGGTAVGEGIGEELSRVILPTDYGLVLANPGFPVSTAAVFRELDSTLTREPKESKLWSLLRERPTLGDLLENDLQPIAEEMYPEIAEIRRTLTQLVASWALMTGSGPTVFGIVEPNSPLVERIGKRLPHRWNPIVSAPCSHGPLID